MNRTVILCTSTPGGAIQVTLKPIIKGFGFPLPWDICPWAFSLLSLWSFTRPRQ